MSGVTCRPCDRDEHPKCWIEMNGQFCTCPHEIEDTRAAGLARTERNMQEIRDDFIAEYGFMPTFIDSRGNPR